jgi:hypothetical protein
VWVRGRKSKGDGWDSVGLNRCWVLGVYLYLRYWNRTKSCIRTRSMNGRKNKRYRDYMTVTL